MVEENLVKEDVVGEDSVKEDAVKEDEWCNLTELKKTRRHPNSTLRAMTEKASIGEDSELGHVWVTCRYSSASGSKIIFTATNFCF